MTWVLSIVVLTFEALDGLPAVVAHPHGGGDPLSVVV
jgi:hypothetical protein